MSRARIAVRVFYDADSDHCWRGRVHGRGNREALRLEGPLRPRRAPPARRRRAHPARAGRACPRGRLPRRGGRRGLRRGRRGARAGRARRAQHRRERPILRRGYERARLPQTWELAALSALHFARPARAWPRAARHAIFAGATASVRGGAGPRRSRRRARERARAEPRARAGPRGVHVAHVVIDGPVDTPFVRELVGEAEAVRMAERGALIEPGRCGSLGAPRQPRAADARAGLTPVLRKF